MEIRESGGGLSAARNFAERIERRFRGKLWLATQDVRASRSSLRLGPENFCRAAEGEWSVVVDAGVGRYPSFATWIRSQTNAFAVLCDPTPKHVRPIRAWMESQGRAELIEAAVASQDGTAEFFESDNEESGSLDSSHVNRASAGRLVRVETISLGSLVERARRHGKVEMVKLDLEGAEFGVLSDVASISDTLCSVPQWFVEFHPMPQTSFRLRAVAKIRIVFKKMGFRCFSRNGVDYLFWRR